MSALLKKEFSLALHPASALFVFFAAMVFIPNYPYEVMFFFSGLSAFFICLTGRENKDLDFSCVLPVEKREVAAARVLFCMILQLAQIVLCVPFIAIKSAWINMPNLAGMEANAAFLGFGLMMLGGFNCFFLFFFRVFLINPNKVGKPFAFGAVFIFLAVAAVTMCCQIAPLFKDVLDTRDPLHFGAKAVVFALGAAVYAAASFLSVKLSQRNFEKADL